MRLRERTQPTESQIEPPVWLFFYLANIEQCGSGDRQRSAAGFTLFRSSQSRDPPLRAVFLAAALCFDYQTLASLCDYWLWLCLIAVIRAPHKPPPLHAPASYPEKEHKERSHDSRLSPPLRGLNQLPGPCIVTLFSLSFWVMSCHPCVTGYLTGLRKPRLVIYSRG